MFNAVQAASIRLQPNGDTIQRCSPFPNRPEGKAEVVAGEGSICDLTCDDGMTTTFFPGILV